MNIKEKLTQQYLAGFFDGEGGISLDKRDVGRARVHVSLGQNNKEILDLICGQFPGKVTDRGNSRCWQLQFNAEGALAILEYLLPYLIIRRKEAEVAICILRMTPSKGHHSSEHDLLVRMRLEEMFEYAQHERTVGNL